MEVIYKSNKLKKICENPKIAQKEYNVEMADKISYCIDILKNASSVEMIILLGLGRCHPLYGNRKGTYAMELVQPFRLVFEKKGDLIQIVRVLEIVDYHKR